MSRVKRLTDMRIGPLLSGEELQPSGLEEVDIDVPEEVEDVLEELFQSLQDKVLNPFVCGSGSERDLLLSRSQGHLCPLFSGERSR